MSDNLERRQTRRLSSILKNAASNSDSSPTQTLNRRSRRISFSQVNNCKEFIADTHNQTTWVQSYEEIQKSDGSKDNSSQPFTATTNSFNDQGPSASRCIKLFADLNSSGSDLEMDTSSPTKLFNQSMYLCSSATTSEDVESVVMPVVEKAKKRKTVRLTSVDKAAVDVIKSNKIRRMNDENQELQSQHTILEPMQMNITFKPEQKSLINALRASDNLLVEVSQKPMKPLPPTGLHSEGEALNMFDKTSVTMTDMRIDSHQSMIPTVEDFVEAIANETKIYGRGNDSGRIDQTIAVLHPLQENNFQEWTPVEDTSKEIANKSDSHQSMIPTVEDFVEAIANETKIYGRGNDSGRIDQTIAVLHPLQENNLQEWTPVEDTSKEIANKSEIYGLGNESCGVDQTIGVQNPLQENNGHEWKALKIPNESDANVTNTTEMEKYLPACQPNFANSLQRGLHFKHSMDIKNPSPPPNYQFALADEHEIEDLTIAMDTNFNPNLSDTVNDVSTKDNVQSNEEQNCVAPTASSIDASYKNDNENLPPTEDLNYANREQSLSMTLCSAMHENQEKTYLLGSADLTTNDITKEEVVDRYASQDFSFAAAMPLSSTRFVASTQPTHDLSNGDVKTSSNIATFNYCPTRHSQHFRSLQNNTQELCNLEPDNLESEKSHYKQLFLDLSETVDDLSKTEIDLVSSNSQSSDTLTDLAGSKEAASNNNVENNVGAVDGASDDELVELEKELNATKFVTKDSNNRIKLDFSVLEKLKRLPTIRDVHEAYLKRKELKELEEKLLVDQNVSAPDIGFLYKNKEAEIVYPETVYEPPPLICLPLIMDTKFLMKNKIKTEYPQWSYNDNYIFIGAIAMRHEQIPSIRFHIKFPGRTPDDDKKPDVPLLFTKVFIEQCQTTLQNISPKNYLKHHNGLASLPRNLKSILSGSDNIYDGLDEINNSFQSVVAKVDEVDRLTIDHEWMLKRDQEQCYVERTVFDTKNYVYQEIGITLSRVDSVGPENVFFLPPCETTEEFRRLPKGMPFLRAFLVDPRKYFVATKEP